jgi:hypothetical protein
LREIETHSVIVEHVILSLVTLALFPLEEVSQLDHAAPTISLGLLRLRFDPLVGLFDGFRGDLDPCCFQAEE